MVADYSPNQAGIQLYTAIMMKTKYNGKYNRIYGLQYGLCLETQNFPDAINKVNFPSPILRKGEKYKSFTKIKLRNNFI
jgi:Galactose mutarotase and related enzymes